MLRDLCEDTLPLTFFLEKKMSVLPSLYQQYIHLGHYSRWKEEDNRRETWEETVNRYFDFFVPFLTEKSPGFLKKGEEVQLKHAVSSLNVMPSMRSLMTAGPALSRDHVAGYNCAYRAITDIRAFDEILYILMCGTGVGFSAERQFVSQLPDLPESLRDTDTVITVRDSKLGWAEALRELIHLLYAGRIPRMDLSKIRPAGSRLVTMGGRASGPEPLSELFNFIVDIFRHAKSSKLESIECHDIVCKIGDCVVAGGVRRSALLSLSNLSDQRMRDAKKGDWINLTPWRGLANNSVAYTDRPEVGHFMAEWLSLYESKAGERGIFNRQAVTQKVLENGRREAEVNGKPREFGTNPCGEIILRDRQFCNLSEAVCRSDDDFDTLMEKVRLAAILGTWQSCLSNFRYLTKKWKDNTEEERLLGVSLTGIMDCNLINSNTGDTAAVLSMLREEVVKTNKEWSERLGVAQATAATCVKPSGTVSQLVNASSGIHPRFAPHYIRRVRRNLIDPMTQYMIDSGFPYESDITKRDSGVVFSFPVKSPDGAIVRGDWSAVEQLEFWNTVRTHWCEHNPSVTIDVKENEWPSVGGWVFDNFDSAAGLTFLPGDDHIYPQAPYEPVDLEKYTELDSKMPEAIDQSVLSEYENDDNVVISKEFACVAGICEI
jgi:ribonucleoside-diphosphate reductase alpha chain